MFTRHRSKTLPSTSIFPVAFTQRRLAQSCGPDKLPRKNLDLAMIQSTRFSGDLRDGSVPKEIASDLSLPISMVTRVRNRWLASEHKRRMPLTPKLGFRTVGMDLRLPYLSSYEEIHDERSLY